MISYLKHFFLPHHTNNFRAKLLHVDFFALYAVIFFIFSFSFRTVHKIDPDILGFATDIHVDQLVSLTNQKRSAAGLPSLNLNSQLSQAAAGKASDMFSKNYWAHTAPDGTTPWDFINGAGYVYTVAGENLAKNFSNSEGVVEAWMNSPSHRENIERGDYQDIGFAVINGTLNGEETTLVVQMFGKRLSAPIAQKPVENPPIVPPVDTVLAQEESTPVARFTSEPEVSPAEIASIAAAPLPPQDVKITAFADSVTKKPLIDIGSLSKFLTLGLIIVLTVILFIDGMYIWRKGIARVGGRNAAHMLFLFTLIAIVWFMSFGQIL